MFCHTALSLPCTEDVPTCGGTCDKPLACGRHKCTQQCHTGSCGVCRQLVTKTCRCGKREKNVLCSQEFLCEVKCLKMRQCERHPCKRKVSLELLVYNKLLLSNIFSFLSKCTIETFASIALHFRYLLLIF